MIHSSRRVVVVADHSKLGRFSPYRVASCSEVDTLVTDCKADAAIVEAFRSMGVEVLIAGNPADCGPI